jgi:hypothetical protein
MRIYPPLRQPTTVRGTLHRPRPQTCHSTQWRCWHKTRTGPHSSPTSERRCWLIRGSGQPRHGKWLRCPVRTGNPAVSPLADPLPTGWASRPAKPWQSLLVAKRPLPPPPPTWPRIQARVSQETEQLSLGKGPQGQANEARLTADAASADGRVTLAGQAGTLPGASTLDALGTFSRMAANPRGGDRPAARTPFVPAGSALAGSWSDHAMPSGSPATLTTYAPDATVAVPDAAVAEKLNYWISRGVQNAELQLDAFGGGTVKVSISVHGQDAQVDFRSDQPEARKLLQDAMPQLSAMLKGEGLLLSGGFVGSQTQQHPGAQERRSSAQNMRSAIIGVGTRTTEPAPALSRSPGRAVDLFV